MDSILTVKDLTKNYYRNGIGWKQEVSVIKAVDSVSFVIKKGKSLGLVGESGCGKSTLGRSILRLEEPDAGQVFYKDQEILRLRYKEFRSLKQEMQIIFQDPYASLHPGMTVYRLISEPLNVHNGGKSKEEIHNRVTKMCAEVGLKETDLDKFPHEFSGGQRQRICIARALILNPSFIVCDEPVAALDVSIQSQILNLLRDLQDVFGITYLFISHNLNIVNFLCTDIAVMYLGRIVEIGDIRLLQGPFHPYTQALLSAVPVLNQQDSKNSPNSQSSRKRVQLKGELPSQINQPSGCTFHTRCLHAFKRCKEEVPSLRKIGDNHWAACFLE